jgi:hypothetical protein
MLLGIVYQSILALGAFTLSLAALVVLYLAYLKFVSIPRHVAFYEKQPQVVIAKDCNSLVGNTPLIKAHLKHLEESEDPLFIKTFLVNEVCKQKGLGEFDAVKAPVIIWKNVEDVFMIISDPVIT